MVIIQSMSLSPEQTKILQEIQAGRNVFMTGCGGTGKSFTIRTILKENLQKQRQICLTALTGCAAILLDTTASTLHSFAGIGLGDKSVPELVEKIHKNTTSRKRWKNVELLIVDEVSMLSAELFEKLEEIARIVRKNPKPFGGIQLLFVGDFYQLPPISSETTPAHFAFESPLWRQCFPLTSHIELTENHRQKDVIFQKILQESRIGKMSEDSISILNGRKGISWKDMKIKPTLLFPRKKEVEFINKVNLDSITNKKHTFYATIVNQSDKKIDTTDNHFNRTIDNMDKDTSSYMSTLVIAKDTQIMLTYNLDIEKGLVNGSRGIVYDFDMLGMPMVEFINGTRMSIPPQLWPIKGYDKIHRSQSPLRLAYAVTIHKSQGSTLDCALIDIGPDIFEYGQAYVALSRVRSLDSLYVHNFSPTAIRANPTVAQFYKQISVIGGN